MYTYFEAMSERERKVTVQLYACTSPVQSSTRVQDSVTGLASIQASRKLNSTVVDIDLCMECCILASTTGLCLWFRLDEF